MIRTLILLAVWAGLAALAAAPFLAATEDTPVAAPDPGVPPGLPGLADTGPPPLAALSETRTRPLFFASRRPPAAAVAMPATAEPPPARLDRYRLTGIVRSSAKLMILLQESATGRVVELHEGERIEGWTVTRIEENLARLVSGGREIVLSQDPASAQAPTAGGRATRWLPSR